MFGLNARQVFLLLLLIAALFAGAQYIPVYFKALQFNDFIKSEARFAGTSRKSSLRLGGRKHVRASAPRNSNSAAVFAACCAASTAFCGPRGGAATCCA